MLRLLFLLSVLAASPASARSEAARLSAMTFNIRLDLASDGENSWLYRRGAATGLIAYHAPDIVGLQEVLPGQKRDVEADLPHYGWVGVARDDGKDKGEYSPLGYLRHRFELKASGTFWLSPTPSVPAKGWDAALPRIATWARLADRQAKREFLVVNTHFDHVGATARLESARQILAWIAANRKRRDAVILLGDFNSPTGSPPHALLAGDNGLRDTMTASRTAPFGPRGTFTGFRIEHLAPDPIDHVFVSSDVAVLRHATLTHQVGGKLPSDHYPVLVDLCTGRNC